MNRKVHASFVTKETRCSPPFLTRGIPTLRMDTCLQEKIKVEYE